jgi:hypothetical protein
LSSYVDAAKKLTDGQIDGLLEDLPEDVKSGLFLLAGYPVGLLELVVAVFFEKLLRADDDVAHKIDDFKTMLGVSVEGF